MLPDIFLSGIIYCISNKEIQLKLR